MNTTDISVEILHTKSGALTEAVVITVENNGYCAKILQSYSTQVLAKINGVFYVTPDVNYSNTTRRHVLAFTGGISAKELLQNAKDEKIGFVLVENDKDIWENIGGAC